MAGGIAKIIQYRNFPRLGRMHFSKGAGILRVSSLSLPAHFSWSTLRLPNGQNTWVWRPVCQNLAQISMLFNQIHFFNRGNLREYRGNIRTTFGYTCLLKCSDMFTSAKKISMTCASASFAITSLKFEEMSWCDWTGVCEQHDQMPYRTCDMLSQFSCSIAFIIPRCVCRIFFHTWVSQVYIYIC